MKFFYLCLLLFSSFYAFCQDQNPRGGLQLKEGKGNINNIKALVVGVSRYANYPDNAQLKYADDDAIAFAQFLRQHTSVTEENIVLLTNEDAVFPNVFKKLIDQLKASQEGDLLIIYFAGHGDVNYAGDAYLITNDAFAPDEEGHSLGMGGAIPINMLQGYIAKATSERNFKVMMVTDACRSGHLTKTDNSAATITALIKDWNNTYKYVSCGPNQLSQEGTQWGGGHGAFTYYMLKGLMGEADRNEDKKIFYGELNSYVNQKVSDDTGYKQYPQFKGEAIDVVVNVDEKLLDLVRQNDYNLLEGAVASRSVHAKEVISKEQIVQSFYEAIDSNRIIHPKFIKHKERLNLKFLKPVDLGSLLDVFVSGKKIIISKNPKKVALFDIETEEQESFQVKHYPKLMDYNNRTLVYTDKENLISIYNGKQLVKEEKYHKATVKSLKVTENGLVFSGDEKGNVFLISEKDAPKRIFKVKGSVNGIAASENGKVIVVKNENGEIALLNQDYNMYASTKLSSSPNHEMYFMKDDALVVGVNFSTIRAINVSDGKTKKEYRLPNSEKSLKVTKVNENYLLVLSDKSNLFYLNIDDGTFTKMSSHPFGRNFKWSSNQSVLASISTSAILTAEIDVPYPYANEWYEKIQQSTEVSEKEKNDVKNKLAVALQSKAQNIITPFILGKNITPSALEIKEAIYELNYATQLYKETPELVEMINIRRWFLQAYLIIVENKVIDFPLAISYFEKILKVTPNAAYPHNGIAVINQKLMKLEKSKESVAIAEKLKPTWTEPKTTMVNTFLVEENFLDALSKNEEIIKIIPNNIKGYYGKAQIYLKMGYYQDAWALVKKMEEIKADDPGVWETKVAVLVELGRLKDAMQLVQNSSSLNEKTEKGYIVEANLWKTIYDRQTQSQQDIVKAEKLLQTGMHIYPTSAELKGQLAKLYTEYDFEFKKGSNTVNTLIDEALILNPYNATALRYKAQYAMQVEHNVSLAKQSTVNYTNKRGAFSDLDIFLANVAYAQKDLKTIESCSKAALLKNPYKLENYQLLWSTYVENNMEEELQKLYLMGKDMLPNSPWFSYKYGLYYKGRKENRKAASYIETALSISPDFNFAYVVKNPTEGIKELYNYNKVNRIGAFYKVYGDGSQGLIDYAGRSVVPLKYKSVKLLDNGFSILTTKSGKMELSSPEGHRADNPKYDDIFIMECGMMRVQLGNKYGCVNNETGKLVVPIKFERITNGHWTGDPAACCRYNINDAINKALFFNANGECVSCD